MKHKWCGTFFSCPDSADTADICVPHHHSLPLASPENATQYCPLPHVILRHDPHWAHCEQILWWHQHHWWGTPQHVLHVHGQLTDGRWSVSGHLIQYPGFYDCDSTARDPLLFSPGIGGSLSYLYEFPSLHLFKLNYFNSFMLAIKTLNENTSYKKEKTQKLIVLLKFKYTTVYVKKRCIFFITAFIVKIFYIILLRDFTLPHLDNSSGLSLRLAPLSTAILVKRLQGRVSFEPSVYRESSFWSLRKEWTQTKSLLLPATLLIGNKFENTFHLNMPR